MRNFVTNRPLQLALLPERGKWQQVDREAIRRAGHPPGLTSGPAEAIDRGMHRHPQSGRWDGAGRLHDFVAALPNQRQQRAAIAFLGSRQREDDIGDHRGNPRTGESAYAAGGGYGGISP